MNVVDAIKAQLQDYIALNQLGTMLAAGVTVDKALLTLSRGQGAELDNSEQGRWRLRLASVAAQVANGVPLSNALVRQDCLNLSDAALLSSAESAGRVAEALSFISQAKVAKVQRLNTLKAGLVMPLAVLIIGLFAGLFIKLLTGASVLTALLDVLAPGLTAVLVVYAFFSLLHLDLRAYLSVIWSLPTLKDILNRYSPRFQIVFESCFYPPLLWQIESGVNLERAIKNNQTLLSSHAYQTAVDDCARSIANGNELDKALTQCGLVLSYRLKNVLKLAHQSGRFYQAIASELAIQRQSIDRSFDNAVSWLPKLAYVLVLFALSRFIL